LAAQETSENGGGRTSLSLLFQGILFLCVGVFVSYLGYWSSAAFLDQEVIGPVLFWSAALLLLLAFPFREPARACYFGIRTKLGGVVFPVYLVIHLLVYGFLLELLLAAVYGIAFTLTPSVTVATEVFVPPTAANLFFDLSFNPSVSFSLPPVLSGALSTYAIAVAVLVDILIVANVAKVRELGDLTTRSLRARSYFLIPLLGLVLGASCCISLPALVSFALPSLTVSQSFDWIYDTTYFFFPLFAVAILYLNLRSVHKLSDTMRNHQVDSSEISAPSQKAPPFFRKSRT
jgi:hypothetical protein